jgi:hypothetical protein
VQFFDSYQMIINLMFNFIFLTHQFILLNLIFVYLFILLNFIIYLAIKFFIILAFNLFVLLAIYKTLKIISKLMFYKFTFIF